MRSKKEGSFVEMQDLNIQSKEIYSVVSFIVMRHLDKDQLGQDTA